MKGTLHHILITVLFSLIHLGWLAAVFYVGREVTQAEYRYIEVHGKKRENCPWYCGFIPSAWNKKSLLDCLLPCVIASIFSIIYML